MTESKILKIYSRGRKTKVIVRARGSVLQRSITKSNLTMIIERLILTQADRNSDVQLVDASEPCITILVR